MKKDYKYGDKIKINNRTYKVVATDEKYIYFGVYGDKILREDLK